VETRRTSRRRSTSGLVNRPTAVSSLFSGSEIGVDGSVITYASPQPEEEEGTQSRSGRNGGELLDASRYMS